MRVNYAIVFVSDMKRSVLFYRDVLGLLLRFETPEWTEFATEGSTIALHVGKGATPGKDRDNTAPGQCRPGFCVPDLDKFHRTLVKRGAPCIQEPQETFGVRIAQYLDPDALVISVSEDAGRSAAEVTDG